jgi:hypothetical protein
VLYRSGLAQPLDAGFRGLSAGAGAAAELAQIRSLVRTLLHVEAA